MKLLSALMVVCLGCMAGAQTASPAQAPAKKAAGSATKTPASSAAVASSASQARPTSEQVMKLLGLMGVQDGLQITVEAMKDQIKGSAEQALQEKIPQPTPEQIKAAYAIVDDEFKKLSFDSMILDIVPVYQRHFSRADVDQLLAFYSSPVGKKIVHEQPVMMKESMQATQAAQRQKMELLLARMDLRIQQLISDEQKKTGMDKK
jgi:uncharacterized protein